jgi:phage terminase large subunit-like protein
MARQEVIIGSACDVFQEFLTPSRYKVLFGGRGSAKSRFFGECMVANAASTMGFRAVCVREVQKSLKESAKRLIEDTIYSMGFADKFVVQADQIKTPGGGTIIFQGMADHTAESIKSLEGFNVAWVEEAQSLSQRSLELLRPTIREVGSELWFSFNPRSASDPVDKFFRGLKPPSNAIIHHVNYDQNKFFPKELEEERLHDKTANPDRYSHIWLGDYEPQAIGAIWTRHIIHENRRAEMTATRERTVVAVDPAVSNNDNSDEHGIAVCAIGSDQRGYLLEDASMSGMPHQWAARAVAMYDKWDADAIVIEKNQGGDMCRHTIETVRRGIRIIEVHATRGKHVRAEPISALYTLGRISHIGTFEDLENQLCVEEGTLIETDRGQVPIEDVTLKDMVVTRNGLALISWCGYTGVADSLIEIKTKNSTLRTTECHPIYDIKTEQFVDAKNVNHTSILLESSQWELTECQSHGEEGYIRKLTKDITATNMLVSCIETYTKPIMALLLKGIISTTSIMKKMITAPVILNKLLIQTIKDTIGLLIGQKENQQAQKKECALCVGEEPAHMERRGRNTVPKDAICVSTESQIAIDLNLTYAQYVEKKQSHSMGITKCIAPINVSRKHYGTDVKRVYNITVADGFLPEYFANGILTHNCNFTSSGYDGPNSPDRAEAAIWGFTELFPKLITEHKEEKMEFYGNGGGSGGWMG